MAEYSVYRITWSQDPRKFTMKYPYKIIVFIVLGCMLFMLFNIRNKNNAVNKNKSTDPLMEIPRSSNGELFTNKTGAKIVNESKWEISNIVKNISTTLPNKYLVRVYQKDKPVDEMDFIQRQSKVVMNSTIELPQQKRCAVIGNSGILLNSGCGDEINSHNFVIRCNIPAISEFTRDVGYKTNMMIVYQKTALELYNFSTNGSMPEDFRRRCQDLNDSIIWYPGVFSSRIRNVWKTNLNYLRSTLHIPAIFAYTTDTDLTSTVKR
ncbi:alpha-2,8-sialyltransferase 8E-like [Saccoglossus kowalevskii]|uniref:CMP-N-acetylneuraminate-poly-alpha-2, 8-sialyltransferase-like n=1 Tax=Saccoglossus kowalevskii TaxID=10224 RepID=A0ABM0MKT7_SACKO|nr:PREDICTED: CMP-N-acetylneuraminate-poly-alpha-2,8-sialyltransferase-like [Saccoglossus kowalevskii]